MTAILIALALCIIVVQFARGVRSPPKPGKCARECAYYRYLDDRNEVQAGFVCCKTIAQRST